MKSWLQVTWWEFVFAYTWVVGFYLPETDGLPLLVCTISKRKIWKLLMYLKVEFYKYTFLLTARRWTYFIWLQCWTKWHSSAFDTFWIWSSYHCFCDRSGWRSQSLCSFQLQEQSQKNKQWITQSAIYIISLISHWSWHWIVQGMYKLQKLETYFTLVGLILLLKKFIV